MAGWPAITLFVNKYRVAGFFFCLFLSETLIIFILNVLCAFSDSIFLVQKIS